MPVARLCGVAAAACIARLCVQNVVQRDGVKGGDRERQRGRREAIIIAVGTPHYCAYYIVVVAWRVDGLRLLWLW